MNTMQPERKLIRLLAWASITAFLLLFLVCITRDASGEEPMQNHRAALPYVFYDNLIPQHDLARPTFRRLEVINWTPNTWTLKWSVSEGYDDDKGEYHITASQDHTIDLNAATMTVGMETRKFSEQEAQNVGQVFGLINKYCRESTDWWKAGKGEPVGGKKLVAEGK